ncbi:MAG: hypothetical protein ACE5OR_06800 [bacterium]
MRRIDTDLERYVLSERPDLLVSWIGPEHLKRQRWFLHKSATIKELRLRDSWVLKKFGKADIICTILDVEYSDSQQKDAYYMPLLLNFDQQATGEAMAKIHGRGFVATLSDCLNSLEYYQVLMKYLWAHAKLKSAYGRVDFRPITSCITYPVTEVSEFTGEQSNTVMFVGKEDIVKTFRKMQPGVNPDLEIHLKLGTKTDSLIPKLCGHISYSESDGDEYTLAIIEEYVFNDGDAWQHVLKKLGRFFDYARKHRRQTEIVGLAQNYLTSFGKEIRQLGQLIAELHSELAHVFGSEDISQYDLIEWHNTFLNNTEKVLIHSLKLPDWLLKSKGKILKQSRKLLEIKDPGKKIRIHGDLHLGQVLKTSGTRRDFCVIDFEGEPLKSYKEVRKKHSPLQDVAGMLRSFNYAVYQAHSMVQGEEKDDMLKWAQCWEEIVCHMFLKEYLHHTKYKGGNYLPEDETSLRSMIALFKLEKALYELQYEINSRPEWVGIPLQAIRKCLLDLEIG